MASPGLYRHYKGNIYRVLFEATWADSPPATDAIVTVGANYMGHIVACVPERSAFEGLILEARWSGNTTDVVHTEPLVVYVALYGIGRVSVRPEKEFDEGVPKLYGGPGTQPRFVRVCD